LMGEPSAHSALVHYLVNVLNWMFHGQTCAIHKNLNFYQTPDSSEYPEEPDIAVIKGVAYQPTRSWRVSKSGPAPHVVFEIASLETWKKDLEEKPLKYARMGVHEYFAYDPHEPPLPKSSSRRLFGWRLGQDGSSMKEMPIGPGSSLWSPHLESWLVPDGAILRLYDHSGQLRLTQAQAEARRAQVLAEKLRSLGVDPDQLL